MPRKFAITYYTDQTLITPALQHTRKHAPPQDSNAPRHAIHLFFLFFPKDYKIYKGGTHEQQHLEGNLIYKPAVPKYRTDRDAVQANASEVLKIGYPLGRRLSD